MRTRTWLADLPTPECAALLELSWLGRLGVTVDGHPEIFPVNHVFDRATGTIVFPTNARTKLHAALSQPLVAFEVDGVDPDGASAWSVLVVGRAHEETDRRAIAAAMRARRPAWAVSETTRWLRIEPVRVTGRRIALVEG
jgi:nitroimidazol reductase NimA-like FMN-containing flavoprotein (pyridoxamine 5'-phosphate oxidase superfamily)